MKIEQLIARYLFQNRRVSLQQIGLFQIAPDVVIPSESDKDFTLPEGSVIFHHDPKAMADEGFIEYIMEQTRKIRPLASSDLESFTILGKQFMNIGKPLDLEGLGQLLKDTQAGILFIPYAQFHSRINAAAPALREKEKTDIDFSSPSRKGYPKWMGFLLLAGMATVLFAVFYLIRERKQQVSETPVIIRSDSPEIALRKDTMPALPADSHAVMDSIVPKPDSVNVSASGMTFIIREFSQIQAAQKTWGKLTSYGHKLDMETSDSTHHFILIHVSKPLSDSISVRDSLKTLFGGQPRIR